ncbi:head-tail connector protein [Hymenobacter sp. HD11105]
MYALTKRLTLPVLLALTLVEAKAHCQVDGDEDNDYLTALIRAAGEAFEAESNQALMQASYISVWPAFGSQLDGLRQPVGAVSKVAYTPAAGTPAVELEASAYALGEFRPDVLYVHQRPLPASQPGFAEAVRVYYTAGYASAEAVPEIVKQWLKFMVRHWYDSRQPVETALRMQSIPLTATYLMNLIREPVL